MKIGLVLSGGGAKGIAHLGALRALEDFGIRPSIISGSSAGALAGAFYAAGFSPEEIMKITQHPRLVRKLRPGYGLAGLIKSKPFKEFISEHLGKERFEDLNIELHICATNLNLGRPEFFSSGPLIDPLIASGSIPVVFTPMEINGHLYVDGGILNNFPVEPIEGKCDYVIGVDVNSFRPSAKDNLSSAKKVMERSLMLMAKANTVPRQPRVDLFIEPQNMCDFKTFDIKKGDLIFERGYEEAKSALEQSGIAQKFKKTS